MVKPVICFIACVLSICSALAFNNDFLSKQCESKNRHACWRLATAFRNEGKEAMAFGKYKESCSYGYAPGCYEEGNSYFYGQLGQKIDLNKAKSTFKKGCDLGNEMNCLSLKDVELKLK